MAHHKPVPAYLRDEPRTSTALDLGVFDVFLAAPAAQPAQSQGAGVLARMGDAGVSLLKGAIAVPEAAVGLADLVSGGQAGHLAEQAGFRPAAARGFLDTQYSNAQQAANHEVQQAQGFLPVMSAALRNPSTIVQGAIESLPLMGGGGVVARGLMKALPALGMAAAAGAGEGVVTAGSQAEQVRQGTADGLLTPQQAGIAAASGAVTGGIGAIAGRLANRLGIGDVDQLVAGGGAGAAASSKSFVRKVLEGAMSEGVLEELPQSVQEQVAVNYALGKPLDEGVDQAAVLGMLSGGLMGGAAGPMGSSGHGTQRAGDSLRDTKLPENGPVTRAVNAAVEAEAGRVDLGLPTLTQQQADAAMGAMEAQARADEKSLRAAGRVDKTADKKAEKIGQPPLPDTSEPSMGSAKVVDTPYLDRVLTLREQMADKSVRAKVRSRFGPKAFSDLAYYASAADNPALPERTRENMVAVAERIVADALLQRQEPTSPPRVQTPSFERLPAKTEEPPRIGLDLVPTGRMVVGPQGVRAETQADRINQAQRQATQDAEAQRQAELGLTPDVQRAQVLRTPLTPQLGDVLNPQGEPFRNEGAAKRVQKTAGGEVQAVHGGWVVRPVAANIPMPQAAPVPSEAPTVAPTSTETLDQAAHEAATSPNNDLSQPTEAQREAGNFKMGHVRVGGLDVTVEYPKGAERTGTGTDGQPWRRLMRAHYGYLRRTQGADGEPIDVYVGERPNARQVYVIDQHKADGSFDEHKVMLGYPSIEAAQRGYKAHYPRHWKVGPTRAMSMDEFKVWLKDGDQSQPATSGQAPAVASAPLEATEETRAGLQAEGAAITPVPAKAERQRLDDAGEELLHNRRNRPVGLAWKDVATLNDALKVRQIVKTNIWPRPHYAQLVEQGAPAWKAALLKVVYDRIVATPATRAMAADADFERYMAAVTAIQEALTSELDHIQRVNTHLTSASENTLWLVLTESLRGAKVFSTVFPSAQEEKRFRVDPFDRSTSQGKENNARALIIGGHNATSALQFDYKALRRARALVAEGFPAKQESWQRSFEVVEQAAPKAAQGSPIRYVVRAKGPRQGTLKDQPAQGFAEREQAEEFARALTARKPPKDLPPSRNLDLDAVRRMGPEWRAGRHVSAHDVRETFGFRGVNLGEYVKADQPVAQVHLDHAFDALMDLADLIGVPPRALSLNGTLGLAIGAQGSGSALAHFVPGVNEINITKASGAGALAHEWAHALDHYFATQHSASLAKQRHPMLSVAVGKTQDRKGVRQEVWDAFKTVMQTIEKREATQQETRDWLMQQRKLVQTRLQAHADRLRSGASDPVQFDAVVDRLLSGDIGTDGGLSDIPTNLSAFMRVANLPDGDARAASVHIDAMRLAEMRDEQRFIQMHRPQIPTDFSKASDALDATRKDAYWGTPHEKFARAFETYVSDALHHRRRQSLYLSGLVDSPAWSNWATATGGKAPYPSGEERVVLGHAFHTLMSSLQSQEDGQGNVALLSRASIAEPRGATGTPAAEIERALRPIVNAWNAGPSSVTVVQSVAELPADVQEGLKAVDAAGEARAFLNPGTGRVFLIADNLANIDEAQFALFHEVYGHFGLRAVLGDDYLPMMTRLRSANTSLAAEAAQWFALYGPQEVAARVAGGMPRMQAERLVRALAVEEALADRAGRNEPVSHLKQLLVRIQRALRRLGLDKVANWLENHTEAETLELLRRARRAVQAAGSSGHALQTDPREAGDTTLLSRRSPLDALRAIDQQAIRDAVADHLHDAGKRISWWDKTLGTQYAKAEKYARDPATAGFKTAFDAVQSFLEGVSTLANEAADLAPGILPPLDTWRDLARRGLSDDDAKAVAAPIFEGTLVDKKVYSDDELRRRFSLTPDQIEQYQAFRAAVNTSLDQAVAADVLRLVGDDAPVAFKQLAMTERAALRQAVDDLLTQRIKESPLADRDGLEQVLAGVREKYARVEALKQEGYAPLMRFGHLTVTVRDPANQEVLYFGLFENRAAANRMARDLGQDETFRQRGATVEQGMLSQAQFKLFAGVPVESLEMFAAAIGADKDEAYQQFLRLTKNNRSALKRLIHRKGTAGFSQDVPRVLAAFVTSNARLVSSALNLPKASQAAQSIRAGDVKDEAIALIDAATSPYDNAAALRGLMFMNFIGGSIASALVNLTQPLTMTAPYLSQWGGMTRAATRLVAASKMAASGKVTDVNLRNALAKAERDGIVSPQEIHHLTAQAMGSWGTNPVLKKAAFIWGSGFSLAEQFNRRVTFLAAYQTAQAEGIKDPFAFAQRAVTETQGLYNRGNAPNWARNPIGAVALTFKQFSIHYVEWLTRMWHHGPAGRRAGTYSGGSDTGDA